MGRERKPGLFEKLPSDSPDALIQVDNFIEKLYNE
jgi:hypothetical protein